MNHKRLDRAHELIDMARGLIPLGKAHDLLGEAMDEINPAIPDCDSDATRRAETACLKASPKGGRNVP